MYADAPSNESNDAAPPVASERQAKEIAGRYLKTKRLRARDMREEFSCLRNVGSVSFALIRRLRTLRAYV